LAAEWARGHPDGEVVQAKFLLYLPEQFLAWLVQTDPDEAALLLENFANVLDFDVGHPLATGIGRQFTLPHICPPPLYRSPARFSDAFPSFLPFLVAADCCRADIQHLAASAISVDPPPEAVF
jgi:hypothetical protein